MATLIALGRVFVCALCSSKQSCESAGSLGKVNLAVADGSELIAAEELRGASARAGGWGSRAVSLVSGSSFSCVAQLLARTNMAVLPVQIILIPSSWCRHGSQSSKPKHSTSPHSNFRCLSAGMNCVHDVEGMITVLQ